MKNLLPPFSILVLTIQKQVIPIDNKQIIPFCALYLTDANGQRLYIGDQNGNLLCRDVASQ